MAEALSTTLPVLHEDLSDVVQMVDYEETLMSSTTRAGKPATASKYAETADNPQRGRLGGKGETRSVDRSKVQNRFASRKKIEGIVQEKIEDYGISDRVKQVENPAGINDAKAEAYTRTVEAFKQGMEMTFLSQQVQNEDAYLLNEKGVMEHQHLTGGASFWCDQSPLGSVTPDALYRPAAALNKEVNALADFDEDALRDLMQAKRAVMNRKCNSLVFCTLDFQTHVDGFFDEKAVADGNVHIRSFRYEGGSPDFEVGLKSYKTSHGKIMLNATQHLNAVRNFGAVDEYGEAVALTCATTNTSTTVNLTPGMTTRGLQPFMRVKGTGIPAGAYIASITDEDTFVLSAAATATGTGVALTFGYLDHALFLEMDYFQKKMGKDGIKDVDLTPDASGEQGYVQGFFSLFCGLPKVQAKVFQKN